MKPKTIVTLLLLAFVAVSIVFVVAKELRPSTPAAEASSATPMATAETPNVPAADPAVVPASAPETAAATNTADDAEAPEHQVQAYYFYTNTRCPSCLKIEQYTGSAIHGSFAKALKDGKLTFEAINTDEKGNEHYVKDYELVTKSVILVDMHKGKPARWVNLEKVWDLTGDEKRFKKYIVDNVKLYLDEDE